MPNNKIILGIDPGYGRMGIAVLENTSGKQKILHSECFETSAKLPHHERLLHIGTKLEEMILKFEPNQIALETLLFSKNQKTAMQVSEARGVMIFVASKYNIRVREFNPNQIKLAVTGYGKSDKKQVIDMVEKLLRLEKRKRVDDEYDAIAIALTAGAISFQSTLSTEVL